MTTAGAANDRKLVWSALALFIGLPAVAAAFTAFNVARAFELDARASQREEALKQIERRIRSGAGSGGTSLGDTSGIYLAAASSSLAKAELQELVVRLIERTSGRLMEAQASEDATGPGDNRQIQLRVVLDATNESLLNFLYELETGLPLLTVQQINIRKLPIRNGASELDPPLRVALVVQGHWSGAAR